MFPIVYFLSPFSLVVQNRYFQYCILKFTILSSFFFIFLLIPHIEDCVLISVIVFFSSLFGSGYSPDLYSYHLERRSHQ